MLDSMNTILQRSMPVLAPASLIGGLLLGHGLAPLSWLIPWCFALMTFSACLSLTIGDLRRTLSRPGFLAANLLILHGLMPLCAWIIGRTLYADPLITTGLVIIALAPVGTTSLIWVSLYRGRVSLALAVILVDTLLAPALIPLMLKLLSGAQVALDSFALMRTLFLMILLPSLAAVALNRLSAGGVYRAAGRQLALLSKLAIMGILLINGSLASGYVREASWLLLGLLVVVFCLCCLGYVISFYTGKRLFHDKADIIAFMMCGGLRNVGAGVALSVLFFPPMVTFTAVIGMLFQQILGCNAGRLADRLLSEEPDAARSVPSTGG